MVIAALLLAAGLVSPAVGVPSLASVARTAKKALKTARGASRTAKSARSTANRADAGPLVRQVKAEDIPAPPGGFARFDLKCPAGHSAVGIGLGLGALEPVFFASYGTGALGSMFNSSATTAYRGDAYVECVESGGYSSASVPRMTKQRALARRTGAESDRRKR